jgi:hypothetical protein
MPYLNDNPTLTRHLTTRCCAASEVCLEPFSTIAIDSPNDRNPQIPDFAKFERHEVIEASIFTRLPVSEFRNRIFH